MLLVAAFIVWFNRAVLWHGFHVLDPVQASGTGSRVGGVWWLAIDDWQIAGCQEMFFELSWCKLVKNVRAAYLYVKKGVSPLFLGQSSDDRLEEITDYQYVTCCNVWHNCAFLSTLVWAAAVNSGLQECRVRLFLHVFRPPVECCQRHSVLGLSVRAWSCAKILLAHTNLL